MLTTELTTPQLIAVWALPVLYAITLHEVAHGWVANKLGDPTARILGRLSLNPLKHIDPIGTILVPALLLVMGGFLFGWAKPVPVGWQNLRHPKRDMAIVALAGPGSNLLMALIWAGIAKLGMLLDQSSYSAGIALIYMGKAGIQINIMLFVLNLLPIPPLDGSRVISGLLPNALSKIYEKITPFGFYILILMIATGILYNILSPFIEILQTDIFLIYGI